MPVDIPAGRYLTVSEAAARAGVKGPRIRQIAEDLGGIRIGDGQMGVWLIPEVGLDAWLAIRRGAGRPRAAPR